MLRWISFCLLICLVLTASADVRQTLADNYVRVTKALQQGNLAPIEALLAQDFKAYTPSGEAIPRDQVLNGFKAQAGSMSNITWPRTIDGLVVSGGKATATVSGHLSATTVGKTRHHIDLIATTVDTWVRLGGKWKLQASHLKASKMLLDGKPASARH